MLHFLKMFGYILNQSKTAPKQPKHKHDIAAGAEEHNRQGKDFMKATKPDERWFYVQVFGSNKVEKVYSLDSHNPDITEVLAMYDKGEEEFLSSDVKTAKILIFADLINNLGHKTNNMLHDLSKGIDGNEFGGRNTL